MSDKVIAYVLKNDYKIGQYEVLEIITHSLINNDYINRAALWFSQYSDSTYFNDYYKYYGCVIIDRRKRLGKLYWTEEEELSIARTYIRNNYTTDNIVVKYPCENEFIGHIFLEDDRIQLITSKDIINTIVKEMCFSGSECVCLSDIENIYYTSSLSELIKNTKIIINDDIIKQHDKNAINKCLSQMKHLLEPKENKDYIRNLLKE